MIVCHGRLSKFLPFMSEFYYYPTGPPQLMLPEFLPQMVPVEDTRPSKRARPDEDNTRNIAVGQEETNNVPGLQTKDKGKKKLGRPQKGCEECKR